MSRRIKFIFLLLVPALLLCGCMRTADQMYQLPKRSEEFEELQKAIDIAMTDLVYCAPISGENQQAVQMADLNGDETEEFILFAKSDTEHPLRILIFQKLETQFVLAHTIECSGTAFDMVEYVNMDESAGVEIVFGSQLADQLRRNLCVYSFSEDMRAQQLLSTGYSEFVTVDLDKDHLTELFVLRPGVAESDNGCAEVYGMEHGTMERSNEMDMSGPADRLKRIIVGNIHGEIPAVYVATTVEETALITDVYTCPDGTLNNITFSNDSGTSVKTMRNYYVYADDIDSDGVVELPYVMPMMPMDVTSATDKQELIRWYAMTSDGDEVVKAYTFHNFIGGWYVDLDSRWASRLSVVSQGNEFVFYIWDEAFENAQKVLSIFALSGRDTDNDRYATVRFNLYENDSILYAAELESCAGSYGITQESVISSFHLIKQDWKTGET